MDKIVAKENHQLGLVNLIYWGNMNEINLPYHNGFQKLRVGYLYETRLKYSEVSFHYFTNNTSLESFGIGRKSVKM